QRTSNSPGALFNEQLRAAQWLNHRYGAPIIGWQHEIESYELADAQSFYDAHYGPNNAILVVAGDVLPDDVRALAEDYYGGLAPNPNVVARDRSAEPPQRAERRLVMSDERVAQPYVSRTYLAPERDAGDQETAAALVFLADVLGGSSATSVLGQALQFETQTAIYTSAFYRGLSLDDTTFGFVVVPAEGVSLQQAEDALDQVIADFMETGTDQATLDRIKTQLRASQIYAKDSAQSQARRYGAALTSGLTVEDVQAWPNILQAVTPQDVMDAAKLVFDRNRAVTGWLQSKAEVSQ
ncbi:MAG: pitrilysin family protein, partial [Pseudomonadota bacterium]